MEKMINWNKWYLIIGLLFVNISVFPQNNQDKDKKKLNDPVKNQVPQQKDIPNQPFEFDLKVSLAGGQLINYNEYKINLPVALGKLDGGIKYNFSKEFYAEVGYKIEGQKGFTTLPGTKLTFDEIFQTIQAGAKYSNQIIEIIPMFKYYWMERPAWPDLYQPNPLDYKAGPDPNFGKFLPTNRNSFKKTEIGLKTELKLIEVLPFYIEGNYFRNDEYIDPNYKDTLPTHLVPTIYTAYAFEAGVAYKGLSFLKLYLKNNTESKTYSYELARDAVTGKTNYKKNKNPLYKELSNKTSLDIEFKIASAGIKIIPFFAYTINIDSYQGYYSYNGYEPGLKFQHKINQFEYSLKYSWETQKFGPNSFDKNSTTDLQPLYKNYHKGKAEVSYELNKNFKFFVQGELAIKETNYPPYKPGINPAKKNYDIEFNFQNYQIIAGTIYKL